MNKKELQSALKSANLQPNKKLGQHFLINDQVALRIASLDGISQGAKVLEIGPGVGALTRHLLEKGAVVTAVEIDAGLCRYLDESFKGAITIHHADFLKIRLPDEFTVCVSNLPYYCASEILFSLAARYSMERVYVMVQKEMAARIAALPDTEQYGALTVSLQMYFDVFRLFNIDRRAFYPQPEVMSSFLHLARKRNVPDEYTIQHFHFAVKSAFWGRRKPIASALARSPHGALDREKALAACAMAGIEPGARGEMLDFDAFIRLARALGELHA